MEHLGYILLSLAAGAVIAVSANHFLKPAARALAAVGLLVGLIIGLSRSPLIAAVATGLIGIVSQYVASRSRPAEDSASLSAEALIEALFPLSLCCIFGILIGITTRVNDVLYFGETNTRARLIALGFSEHQVESAMNRWATTIKPADLTDSANADVDLLNNETQIQWETVWQLSRSTTDPTKQLEFIQEQAPAVDKTAVDRIINEARAAEQSDEQILQSLRQRFGGQP